MFAFPSRYDPLRRLGQGGGGEVWAVRDKVGDRVLALKVLAADAGERESLALVREAVALSGLEGLGVPRVVAFGALPGGQRYMVRELVEGKSLQEVLDGAADGRGGENGWVEALARACEQLTALHRAGLLHGDLKPANIIVGPDGGGTLVDLGLAAPWQQGGAPAWGLTPRFAAPELLRGEPLTVRAEVYALGATLAEALEQRGATLGDEVRHALQRIAARASEDDPAARYPSVDELASAVRQSAGLPARPLGDDTGWPVLALDPVAQDLLSRVAGLSPGKTLVLAGPPGSGRTTLARRLAWTLGVRGDAVVWVESAGVASGDQKGRGVREAIGLEVGAAVAERSPLVVVDDADKLDPSIRAELDRLRDAGARLVLVSIEAAAENDVFEVPPLDPRAAAELVVRAMPSLPESVRRHIVARADGRPGVLRAWVRALMGRPVVSEEDVDAALVEIGISASATKTERSDGGIAEVEETLDRGRFDDARRELDRLGAPGCDADRVRFALAHARIALGRGDSGSAKRWLDDVAPIAPSEGLLRAWQLARARACLRAGEYAEAVALSGNVTEAADGDALAADAFAVHGVALALTDQEGPARESLERALTVARSVGNPRLEAIALGSSAIALQRQGRMREAREAYEGALTAAENARDAATVATMRLNLAGITQAEGDFARALAHLEAAVDMGRRAGGLLAVQQALLNLANLDVYLGRYARAQASIASLASERSALGAAAGAQLFGVEAELASRLAERHPDGLARGLLYAAKLYEDAGEAYEVQGRPFDAAEARLEAILVRTHVDGADAAPLGRALDTVKMQIGIASAASDGEGFREHGPLACLVRAALARLTGDEGAAGRALDEALTLAQKAGRREWAWQALDARAALAASQGNVTLARRDRESALLILEETASRLPRDLREVFWDDPRRRALRHAHAAASPTSQPVPLPSLSTSSRGAGASVNTSLFLPRPPEDRLAHILDVTRELAREHDIERLLPKVIDHAIALLGAERGLVVLVGDQGLEVHTARDRSGDSPHDHFSRSVAEKVVDSGEPVVAVSARDDERLRHAVSVHQLMIQSVACVPIRGAPPVCAVVGALYVETRVRPGRRFHEELPSLSAFADHAAIAIENARLVSENRARADELARANLELRAAKDRLSEILGRRSEQLAEARRDLKQVRATLRSYFGYAGLVGTSVAMRKLYALIDRVKETDIPLLVVGESGTGKEVVARAVHAAGPRAKRPFVGINCGAIPANLLETELFGCVRGAFTGADHDRKGLIREAEGGSLLLDEIGELPPKMQAGLLRVLQDRCVRPVGATKEEAVDTRVIAATNRDLQGMVEEGTFREDLYYRLHVVELRVPPLRERVEDIPALIDHFMTLFSARYRRDRKSVERDALRRLCAYPWPGNVRQLEHVLLSAWLMGDGDEITVDDLELPTVGARPMAPPVESKARPAAGPHASNREEFKASERERILSALSACNWNRLQAAKMIGVPRRTFYRRLKEFGIL